MPQRRNVSNSFVEKVAGKAALTPTYIAFMAISGTLAATALLANSVPLLLGAMIIAPALPPISLIAVAMAGGRWGLAARGAGIALLGLGIAVGLAMVTTWLMNQLGVIPADSNLFSRSLLEERVRPGWYSVVAAVAAGIAGMIALLQDRMDTLIGTVASVALVPAGAAAGIAWVSGDPVRGFGGLALLGINVALIVSAGLLVLAIAGPRAASAES